MEYLAGFTIMGLLVALVVGRVARWGGAASDPIERIDTDYL